MLHSVLRVVKQKLSIKFSQILSNTQSFIALRTTCNRFRIYSMCHLHKNGHPKNMHTLQYKSVPSYNKTNALLLPFSQSRSFSTIPLTPTKAQDNCSITVGVTGASGFVGSHCVQQLLMKGYTVNGTVRSNPNHHKYAWIHKLSEKGKLNLFKANLMQQNSFDEAFSECDFVFHVASRVNTRVNDAQKQMLEPAIKGTENVLNSCLNVSQSKNSKLKRVILTSSTYALYGHPTHNYTYDESHWNKEDTIESHTYAYSKTKAERLAFDWMEANTSKIPFDLISVLPPLIIGPELNQSNGMNAGNIMIGTIWRGLWTPINVIVPITDVRDVAAAHIFFIENKNAVNCSPGRYITVGECIALPSLYDVIDAYSPIKLKTKDKIRIPKLYKRYAEQHENIDIRISSGKIKPEGFMFRDMNDSIREALECLMCRKN